MSNEELFIGVLQSITLILYKFNVYMQWSMYVRLGIEMDGDHVS